MKEMKLKYSLKRTRALMLLLFVFGLVVVSLLAVLRTGLSTLAMSAANFTLSNDKVSDFCDYLKENVEDPKILPYNQYQRPIIDMQNKVFVCVTPKSGITKIQLEYRAFMGRLLGRKFTHKQMNDQWGEFETAYGKMQESVPKTNFTKVFVYRNPVDRVISLYLDKFHPKRVREAWVSLYFVREFPNPTFELLLQNLERYFLKSMKDPHVWPQTDYCNIGKVDYDYIIDIDDHERLSEVFGQWWGHDQVNFDTTTKHATKNSTASTLKEEMRVTIHKNREHFTKAYKKDITFYCDRQKSSPRPERTLR